MKAPRILPFMIAVILLTAAGALVYHTYIAEPGIDVPDEMIVYSIDGVSRQDAQLEMNKFHGYPILGQITITDSDRKKRIMTSLQAGIANSNGNQMRCFIPRHAIRSVTNGQIKDYVICFECTTIAIYENESRNTVATNEEAKGVLDQIIDEAAIPRAKGPIAEK